MNSALLILIEQLFSEHRDDKAKEHVQKLALPVILNWERQSAIFRDGIARIDLWESIFSATYATTYERLKKSLGRRANASALMSQIRMNDDNKNVWRSLLVLARESDRLDRGTWATGQGWQTAIHPADEFGVDNVHFLHVKESRIKIIQFAREDMRSSTTDIASRALVSIGIYKEVIMQPVKIWTVPFQQAAIVQCPF